MQLQIVQDFVRALVPFVPVTLKAFLNDRLELGIDVRP
jgi:hypothetical protein